MSEVKIVIPAAIKSNAVAVSLVQLAYTIAALEIPTFTPSEAVACLRKACHVDHADKLEFVERAEWEKANGDEGSKAVREALNEGFRKLMRENGLLRIGGGRPALPTVDELSQVERESILKEMRAGGATVDGIGAAHGVSLASVRAFAKANKVDVI
jgi:hypothetical protein